MAVSSQSLVTVLEIVHSSVAVASVRLDAGTSGKMR